MDGQNQSESSKFFSDIGWIGLSQGLMFLTGLAILPAITKGYPPEFYGIWSQMMATVGLLSIVLTVQLDSATIRFLSAEDNSENRRKQLGTMLWPVFSLIGVMLLAAFLFRESLSVLLFSQMDYARFVPLVALWASLEALFLFFSAYLRARGRIKKLSVIRLLAAAGRALVIVFAAVSGFDFYVMVWSVIGALAAVIVWMLAFIVRDTGWPRFGKSGIGRFLSYSSPMIPGVLLNWVISASDRFFITHFLGIVETGVYSASYAIASILGILSMPIGMVLFPLVSRLWEQNERKRVETYFYYSIKLYLVLAVPATCGLFILSHPLLDILTTTDFLAPATLVLVLAFGALFDGIVLINNYTVFLANKTRFLPLASLTGAAVNAVINFFLIPIIGIMGAAVSTVASYVVLSIVMVLWGRSFVPYKFEPVFLLKVLLASAAMTLGLWFIDIDGVPGIMIIILAGIVIYGAGLALLRAFTRDEIGSVKQVLARFRTGLIRAV